MTYKRALKEYVEYTYSRLGQAAYFDEFHLETILPPPFLSKIKTPKGNCRWVLKNSCQSRSADTGVKREHFVLKAKNKREALLASAALLGKKEAYFEESNFNRGYLQDWKPKK